MSKLLTMSWANLRVGLYCKTKPAVSVNNISNSYYARKSFLSKHQVALPLNSFCCSFTSYSVINRNYIRHGCGKYSSSIITSNVINNNNFHHGKWSDKVCKYSTSRESDLANKPKDEPEKKLSIYQRFKAMYRDYWYVLLPVHLATSACWFGGFYYMAKTGVDIVALLESLHVSEKLIDPLRNGHSTTGYLALAYALYKISTPLRYTVTIGGTTVSINYLKKWGYIKPVPSKEKLKEMYRDQKESLKEKKDVIKGSVISRFHKGIEDAKKKT